MQTPIGHRFISYMQPIVWLWKTAVDWKLDILLGLSWRVYHNHARTKRFFLVVNSVLVKLMLETSFCANGWNLPYIVGCEMHCLWYSFIDVESLMSNSAADVIRQNLCTFFPLHNPAPYHNIYTFLSISRIYWHALPSFVVISFSPENASLKSWCHEWTSLIWNMILTVKYTEALSTHNHSL